MSEHTDMLEIEEMTTYQSPLESDEETIEVAAEVIEPSNALEVTYTPAVFTDNLAALDAYINKQIEPFKGSIIDPNNARQVKEGRDLMASLNKLKEPIEAERKRIKKAYNEPLKKFEDSVKKITSKIDEVRNELKQQVDKADEMFRENRRALLEEEYIGCAGPIADIIPFSAILNTTWLNRSTTETKAINELYEKAESALKGYKTLQAKELKHKDEVVKHYADTLDLIAALELEDKLNERDREMAEFKAAQEAAALVAQQRNEPEPAPEPESAPDQPTAPAPRVCRWTLAMEFEGTADFAKEVAATLKGMGITGASIKFAGVVDDE